MKEKRPHEQSSSQADLADVLRNLGPDCGHFFFRNSAAQMGRGNYAQCPVGRWARIKVEAHRKHMLKDGGGGLNVNHPDLCSPRSKPFDLDLLLNRDRDILVPRYFPICFRDLVKQYASYWRELVPEHWL
jgi:hypothetical protein